jgi:hypothetical protein
LKRTGGITKPGTETLAVPVPVPVPVAVIVYPGVPPELGEPPPDEEEGGLVAVGFMSPHISFIISFRMS